MIEELLNELEQQSGVLKANVKVEVTTTVRKVNTGEVDDCFNPIRERAVSEDTLQGIANGSDYRYHGCIDIVSDYRLRDRFTRSYSVELEQEED
jgi:hypothetical protein